MKPLLLFYFLLTCSGLASAQQHVFRQDKPDSLTIARNRTAVLQLSAAPFLKGSFSAEDITIPYRLLLPRQMNRLRQYPLVIMLHNSGKIGTDNELQLDPLARTWLRTAIQEQFPAFVLAPQFARRSSNYHPDKGIQVSAPSADVAAILDLLHKLEQEYPNIDRSRIYLVGYSMGASTAQNLMSFAPERFAAMVSIAAVPDISNLKAFSHKPIWLIHGQQDNDNPYSGSVYLFNKLKGNKQLVFTTYTELNHNNITIPFLASDAIPRWLFRQKINTK
ncbi:carboxylesterase family protein [Edaphocola aurantiacus]|uniref:carboxylesterase family protein n=1 Tax=Edaphocola aurantiacus TaxID=2601682 RepID=UPI001C9615DD|nr:PHB depolymerase family esterase [Edaphocola aurantiacus]